MKRLLVILAMLFVPALARAETTGSLRLGPSLGTVPGHSVRPYLGGALRLDVGGTLGERHVLYALARLHALRQLPLDRRRTDAVLTLGAGYTYRFGAMGAWRPELGASVGLGGASVCAFGDSCGASGLALGAELGVRRALGERVQSVVSVEMLAQTGLVNRSPSPVLLLPTLWLGLGF